MQRCNAASATSSCTASVLEQHFATHCTVSISVMKFTSVESPARALYNAVMDQTFAAPLLNADSAIWADDTVLMNAYNYVTNALLKAITGTLDFTEDYLALIINTKSPTMHYTLLIRKYLDHPKYFIPVQAKKVPPEERDHHIRVSNETKNYFTTNW